MKFFEGSGDFINFDDDNEEEECDQALCSCSECGHEFMTEADEEPDKCPSCGFEFDFGVDT
jgi:rubrerythrin